VSTVKLILSGKTITVRLIIFGKTITQKIPEILDYKTDGLICRLWANQE